MTTGVPEEVVVSKKPEAEEPPLAAAVEKQNDVVDQKPVVCAEVVPAEPPAVMKSSKGSLDKDIALAKLEDEKRVSYIKAWEESEKSKVENKAQKTVCDIASWENSKKATLEAKIKQIEESIEKKKADYAERIKNKVALIHKQAEEKRAEVEALKGGDLLKANETAEKLRVTGQTPKKGFGCFGA